jgi:hypothetical protein
MSSLTPQLQYLATIGISIIMSASTATDVTSKTPPVLALPIELLHDIASHLTSFEDLSCLVRTTRLFHHLFTSHLYHRFTTTTDDVRDVILERVILNGRLTSLTSLLDNGLPVEYSLRMPSFIFYSGGSLLNSVCTRNEEQAIPMARLLIQRGADIDAKGGPGRFTALQMAVDGRHYGTAEFLLKLGADVNVGRWNNKPLLAAAHWADEKMAALLIEHGADVSVLDDDDRESCGLQRLEPVKEWREV